MFRAHPVWFVVCVCVPYIGWAALLIWWFQTLCTKLTVTSEKVIERRGFFSKYENEIFLQDVRNVQVFQSFIDRIFGVGRVGISSAGQAGIEIAVNGMPNPDKIKQLIDSNRKAK